MIIERTIDIPAGLSHIDVPLPAEYPSGRVNIELHITPAGLETEFDPLMPMTEVETPAYTQYVREKLAEVEKQIADGTMVWHSEEEVWARLDAIIEAQEAK
jgi:hypothetical protein